MPPKNENKVDEPPTTNEQLQALLHLTTATNHRFDTLTTNMNTLITLLTNQQNNQPPPPPPPLPPPPQQQPRPPKIFLPNFDGTTPLDWLFQATNYFEYYAMPPPQRLSLSVFNFTGEALSWYKYLANNQILGTREEFSRALELRLAHLHM